MTNAAVLAIVVVIFAVIVLAVVQGVMIRLVDASLDEAILTVIGDVEYEDGEPAFDPDPIGPDPDELVSYRVATPETRVLAAWLTDAHGGVIDTYLDWDGPVWPHTDAGSRTVIDGDGESWRVRTAPVFEDTGTQAAWIQVAQPLTFVTGTVARLRALVLAAVPIVVMAGVVAGWFVTGRTLASLRTIARLAANVDAGDLGARINYGGRLTEIDTLASNFDRMLTRLENAFRRERRFLSDAAHELRTPLAVLMGQIEVANSRDRTTREYRETLHILGGYVDRLVRLAADLLYLTRLERVEWPDDGNRETIDLEKLVPAVLDHFSLSVGNRALRYVGPERPATGRLHGSPDQLIRVVTNLVDNAIKYSPEDSEIVVSIENAPNAERITVTNTSAVIGEDDRSRVFDRFYRVENDRSRHTGGSGLGLAITHDIVRRHGGDITFANDRRAGMDFATTTVTTDTRLPKGRTEEHVS
jgi:signal transduction histidine kinase